MPVPPVVLTIAGFDPSSGAGVTADIKTIAAHGCYGVACVTALTVQSTHGVRRVEAVEAVFLTESLEALAADMSFAAVHIGMLGSEAAATAVAEFLLAYKPPNSVLDPILKSTSGSLLLDQPGIEVLSKRLIPLSHLITPNLSEASLLTGMEVGSEDQMRLAADKLHQLGARAVVLTGGHLSQPADLLSFNSAEKSTPEQQFFRSEHIDSNSTHGTGCAFSTSIACNLAHGTSLPDAVRLAQEYVRTAIRSAYPVGKGIGPMNHFGKI